MLCINCGSSTLKFDLVDLSDVGGEQGGVASGLVDRIGHQASLALAIAGRPKETRAMVIADHAAA